MVLLTLGQIIYPGAFAKPRSVAVLGHSDVQQAIAPGFFNASRKFTLLRPRTGALRTKHSQKNFHALPPAQTTYTPSRKFVIP